MHKSRILGIWDVVQNGSSLGSLLMFIEELLLLQKQHGAKVIEIRIHGCHEDISLPYFASLCQLGPSTGKVSFEANELKPEDLNQTLLWDDSISDSSFFGSTLQIQKLCHATGGLEPLRSPKSAMIKAQSWLDELAPGKVPVVLHLKQDPKDQQSNANLDSWKQFFQWCKIHEPAVKFVMVGCDRYDGYFDGADNVLLTQNHGGNLELDLALIQCCFMFMGMASGPCNFALFSHIPYLIWKHPEHHAAEMEKEFQGQPQFSFARENQKFMRAWDTFDSIKTEFELVHSKLDVKNWSFVI